MVLICAAALQLAACGRGSCLNGSEVAALMQEAAELERREKPQAARLKYKEVDLLGCEHGEQQALAFTNAVRLQKQIEVAYADTEAALTAYLTENGEYPDSLDTVAVRIPRHSRAAFAGFKYFKHGKTQMSIVTGLYGTLSFDLHGRMQ
jgi:hypothetical protein